MKVRRAVLSTALACALGVATVGTAQADMERVETTSEKTTTYRGTVTSVDPSASTIILRSETSTAPTTYTFNKETVFVDDHGKVVTYEALKNQPVTITYTREGDRMIVTKVMREPVVQKKETTTTTETIN